MLGEPSRNREPNSLGRSCDERSFARQVEQFKCHGGTFLHAYGVGMELPSGHRLGNPSAQPRLQPWSRGIPNIAQLLISNEGLVGAPGLEPGTR